jgi:lysophospholipid acyltransferase (LPLAT)-like uncharacterized protein
MRSLAQPGVTALASTWRFRCHDEHHWRALVQSGRPFVFVLWHEVLLPLLWRHRRQGIAIVVSTGREGRYLADYAQRIGYHLIHGSSRHGATRALLGAIHELDDGRAVAFTPDGPVGPRRQLKPGLVRAAQKARVPILPLHAQAPWAWRLHSWDRMVIPRPLARVDVFYGAPIHVAAGAAGLADGLDRCAAALAALDVARGD